MWGTAEKRTNPAHRKSTAESAAAAAQESAESQHETNELAPVVPLPVAS